MYAALTGASDNSFPDSSSMKEIAARDARSRQKVWETEAAVKAKSVKQVTQRPIKTM